VYAYQDWEIDLARRELRLRGAPVPIGSRAFEIIGVLVEAAGDTINKYDLMGRVWPGAVVEENTLQFHISAIRKAFGPDRGMLKTAFGRGYRLLGKWAIREESAPDHTGALEQPHTAGQPLLNKTFTDEDLDLASQLLLRSLDAIELLAAAAVRGQENEKESRAELQLPDPFAP